MFKWIRQIKNYFFKQKPVIKAIPLTALQVYIEMKLALARKAGWINPVEEELAFVCTQLIVSPTMDCLKKYDVVYKPDTFGSHEKVQWDYQFDSITTFARGGGDCNSLNRISQAYATTKGYEAYLVTYVATNITKNHTTCIVKKDGVYKTYDYGVMGIGCGSDYSDLSEAVEAVAISYDTNVIEYIAQDINWNFVDES